MTMEEFTKLCRARGAKEASSVMRKSVLVLNRVHAKRLRKAGDDWELHPVHVAQGAT